MSSNAIDLSFHWRTKPEAQAKARANAVFVHAKLVAGGMDISEAARAVEQLFSDGHSEGFEDGYDTGESHANLYGNVADLGDESHRT